MSYNKKLIEVALPLDAINAESAREKSIRHGHPSTLHLWWARRPLASCRAVLFASMVDDPSAHPDKFPTEELQQQERQRLHDLIAKFELVNGKEVVRGLVSWDDLTKTDIVAEAHKEIACCLAWNNGDEPPTEPAAVREYLRKYAPPVYDPFCGGGSIPLEAQRLGLEAYGSDLNPVAVLITKALIEIPPKFAGLSPVSSRHSSSASSGENSPPSPPILGGTGKGKRKKINPDNLSLDLGNQYSGARGLAADVRYYGRWMRDEAEQKIGKLYPDIDGNKVIAWLWARTVKCPNPACGCQMPLVRSFELSTKKGKEAWVEPVIDRTPSPPTPLPSLGEGSRSQRRGRGEGQSGTGENPPQIDFVVKTGTGSAREGTVGRKGGVCIACDTPVTLDYIRSEGKAGRMDARLMAIVAEGKRGRIYLSPDAEHEEIAAGAKPTWKPDNPLPHNPRDFKTPNYGMKTQGDLYTPRQLVALTTFSDLVMEARSRVLADAVAAGMVDDGKSLDDGGTGATAYADAVATYLAFGVDRLSDYSSNICTWHSSGEKMRNTFSRQAIPMTWDYTEVNPFSDSSGNFGGAIEWISTVIEHASCNAPGHVQQLDATTSTLFSKSIVVSTDPPYYDNIGYADLSDFFYVWLRRSLGSIYPNILGTLATPKTEELVATPYRFGGSKNKAKQFFEEGLGKAFARMRDMAIDGYPLTIYYAFKQTENDEDAKGKKTDSVASTGWETMLAGLIKAGFTINGTLPMRTELSNRMVASGTNALASSIALICRPRPEEAPTATRRQFLKELQQELPAAILELQRSNIAPVDLAQASIGPGMAVFSRYAAVVEADGKPMSVRDALKLINQYLDEYLSEQEGAFDGDTRWALTWFEQHQYEAGVYGDAETLSKAKNTSIAGLAETGILTAKGGKVKLLKREEMFSSPTLEGTGKSQSPPNLGDLGGESLWYFTQFLIQTLSTAGEMGVAQALAEIDDLDANAKDLAYRLYTICDRQGWTSEAISYNSLVTSWNEIMTLRSSQVSKVKQQVLVGV